MGWPDDMEGERQRGPRIQECTYHLCWRLDNSRATYTLGGVGMGVSEFWGEDREG